MADDTEDPNQQDDEQKRQAQMQALLNPTTGQPYGYQAPATADGTGRDAWGRDPGQAGYGISPTFLAGGNPLADATYLPGSQTGAAPIYQTTMPVGKSSSGSLIPSGPQ